MIGSKKTGHLHTVNSDVLLVALVTRIGCTPVQGSAESDVFKVDEPSTWIKSKILQAHDECHIIAIIDPKK
jgi:hypothetical protein